MEQRPIHEDLVVTDLVDLLRSLPQVEAAVQELAPELGGTYYDALIEARFGGVPMQLWVEVKADVFPRDAREQLGRWRRSEDAASEENPRRHFLVAAHSVSPGARELLASEGVGYFERGGSLCLPFTGAYTLIDKPAERRQVKDFDLFTEARTPVLQAVLLKPELAYTVHDLAGNTGSSSATVSKLMTQLEREDWVTAEGSGPFKRRKLAKPGAVLDAWVAAETARLPHRRVRRFFVGGRKATDLPQVVSEAVSMEYLSGTPAYHFTAEAAAHHHAPFLTTWSVTTLRALPHMAEQIRADLQAEEVQQGYNLLVVEDGLSALRFSEPFGRIVVASPVQTYVDLMCSAGRAPDAAKHLREQILRF
jgi:hypothetical protein